ncbi:MAG: Hpt domain-containing protein [Bdellovibrionales bacterium]|nr:Hpt domain-containing protein [Bdellovibrionales bacterium]
MEEIILYRLNKDTLKKLESLSDEEKSSFVNKMIDVFFVNCEEKLELIDSYIKKNEYTLAGRAAHNIKSGGQILGAEKFCYLCKNFEIQCLEDKWVSRDEFEKIKQEYSMLKVELEKVKQGYDKNSIGS